MAALQALVWTAVLLLGSAGLAAAQERQAQGRREGRSVDWYFYDLGLPEGKLISAPLFDGRPGRQDADVDRADLAKTVPAAPDDAGAVNSGGFCFHRTLGTAGVCTALGDCLWGQEQHRQWGRTEMCDAARACCPLSEEGVLSPVWDPYTFQYITPCPPRDRQTALQWGAPMVTQHQIWGPPKDIKPQQTPSQWGPPMDTKPQQTPSQWGPPMDTKPQQTPSQWGPPMDTKPQQTPSQWRPPTPLLHSTPPSRPALQSVAARPTTAKSPQQQTPLYTSSSFSSEATPPKQSPLEPVLPVSHWQQPPRQPLDAQDKVDFPQSPERRPSEPSLVPLIDKDAATTSAPRKPGDIARRKCMEYERYAPTVRYGPDKDCVPNHTYPIGGNPAVPTEFPHFSQLGLSRGNSIQWFCGGSLIAPTWVLTAAHCVFDGDRRVQWVRLGDQVPEEDDDDSNPQVIAVAEAVVHPEYKAPRVYNDVALLRLARAPDMTTPHVRPACLQPDFKLKKDKLSLIGFGLTEENGDPAKELMEVALWRTPGQKCATFFDSKVHTRQLPRGIDDDSQLCAGLDQVGKDACQGDSGGPLNTPYSPECMLFVAGVTSFGQGCGRGLPGVYTRVSHFVPWIEGVVWPEEP